MGQRHDRLRRWSSRVLLDGILEGAAKQSIRLPRSIRKSYRTRWENRILSQRSQWERKARGFQENNGQGNQGQHCAPSVPTIQNTTTASIQCYTATSPRTKSIHF